MHKAGYMNMTDTSQSSGLAATPPGRQAGAVECCKVWDVSGNAQERDREGLSKLYTLLSPGYVRQDVAEEKCSAKVTEAWPWFEMPS